MYLNHEQKIIGWGIDRNILGVTGEGTLKGQAEKTLEEIDELILAIEHDDMEQIKDGIGDTFVTMVMLAYLNGGSMGSIIDRYECPSRDQHAFMVFEPIAMLWYMKTKIKSNLWASGIDHHPDGDHFSNLEKILSQLFYCLLLQAAMCGLSMDECVESAWHEIKDRKGRMINGVFVKEADLMKEAS